MADSKQMLQAISYFQKYPLYEKLFSLMRKKYARLGHFGGTLVLDHLTAEEKGVLSGFMGMDLSHMEPVKISFSRLDAALAKSRFDALTWEDILTKYYGMPLLINRDVQLKRQCEKDAFFQGCLSDCTDKDVADWLEKLLFERRSGYRMIEKQFSTDAKKLRQMLQRLIYALEHLPVRNGQKQLLPVFAAMATGNPHYFDDGTTACNLLLNYGAYHYGHSDAKLSGIEQRESLLYQMGILKDDLSNTCLAYGVLGETADGRLHQGLYGFWQEKQAVQVTLNTLSRLSQLTAAASVTDIQGLPAAASATDIQGLPAAASVTDIQGLPAATSVTDIQGLPTAASVTDIPGLLAAPASGDILHPPVAEPSSANPPGNGTGCTIYILENPSAFSYLSSKYPTHAFLCTTGQLKLASYAALDLFPETDTFYYAGDFDPEGLQIAQGLKQRYGKRLVLWNYTKEHYQQAVSSLTLSPARISKLEKIIVKDLLEIKQCLLTEKRPAYQEKMLDTYQIDTLVE